MATASELGAVDRGRRMFRVDRSENRLVRLKEQRFADLNLRERDDLQEWLVRMPDALGEELLIVQKEFDGFADTRERLDLLALDKEGRLVVVESKLDDSGRDVVWQALKYVAYCSSLTKAEIVEIYQNYLDRWSDGANAVANLYDFLDVEETRRRGAERRQRTAACADCGEFPQGGDGDRALAAWPRRARPVLPGRAVQLRRRALHRPAADHPDAGGRGTT